MVRIIRPVRFAVIYTAALHDIVRETITSLPPLFFPLLPVHASIASVTAP